MKKVIGLVLTCLLIAPVLSARDGHYWKHFDKWKDYDELGDRLSVIAKMDYLNGMMDGLNWPLDGTGKLVKVLYETALSNEKKYQIYIDMLDDFYDDYANLNIGIIDALIFCLFRVKGIYDDDVAKEELRTLRKIHGEIKNIVSLRDRVVQDEKWYWCIRVIDGDTIVVKQSDPESFELIGEEIKVRLIGIDCPELSEPDGNSARETTRMLVEGKPVMLSYGHKKKDIYGRTLAYVDKGSDSINETLIEYGWCRVIGEYPFAYILRYKHLETLPRLGKHGIWAERKKEK